VAGRGMRPEPASGRATRPALKLLGLVVGLFSFLTVTYLVAESYGWTAERRVTAQIESMAQHGFGRVGVGLAVVGLLVVDLVLPVPSSLVMTLAGRFLGVSGGFVCNVVGSLGAAAVGYVACRRYGRGTFQRLFGTDTEHVEALFERFGPWVIVLSRPVPMLTEVVSCLAGLTDMAFKRFFALSLLGTAPISLAYAWLGRKAADPMSLQWPLLIAFVLPGIGMAAVRLISRNGAAGPRAHREATGASTSDASTP